MPEQAPTAASPRTVRVLLAGAGNIGSFLALLIARVSGFVRLVDRDRVEAKNAANQDFCAERDVGHFKVDVLAEKIRQTVPGVVVEAIAKDLEDVPVGDFADVDLCLGALDSLRARQVLISERAFPLGIPVIDGGVGAPMLGRVHVYLPASACLECSWQEGHYRNLARETPCTPGENAAGPPTLAPAFVGATVAGIMAGEAANLLFGCFPVESQEIAFDLAHRRFVTSRLRRASRCRFDHEVVADRFELGHDFATATVADLLSAVRRRFGSSPVLLETRRRLFDVGNPALDRFLTPMQLEEHGARRLADLGLTPRDRVRLRVEGSNASAYLLMEPGAGGANSNPAHQGGASHGISTR